MSMTQPSPAVMDDAGELRPARLKLEESSGPVSPRYQYTTRVLITCEAGVVAPVLAIDHSAEYAVGVPAREMHSAAPMARELYERLWKELLALEVFTLGGDLAADRRDRVGVSFNHVEITLGSGDSAAHVRFDYLLPQLDLPENQRRHAVVEILKSLVPPATTPAVH